MDRPNLKPGRILRVVIRDDSPMIHCCDSPSYRSVAIELTDAQRERIGLRCTGTCSGVPNYEVISKCFIEEGND